MYSFLPDPAASSSSARLNKNDFANYFSINPQTGIVSQTNPVLREDQSIFNLLVKVGGRTIINIMNDNISIGTNWKPDHRSKRFQ